MPKEPPRIDNALRYDDNSRLMPGYCPALGSTGTLTVRHAEKYFMILSARHLKIQEAHRRNSGRPFFEPYDRRKVLPEWGSEVDVLCRSIRLLQDYFGRLSLVAGNHYYYGKYPPEHGYENRFIAKVVSDRGVESSLSPAELRDLSALDFWDVLDQQMSRDEAKSLLKSKFDMGVKLFVKAFNEATSKPLIPKSPTVSKDFNPNTAALVKQARMAEAITPVQIRRVNACYLLDAMRSDLAFVEP